MVRASAWQTRGRSWPFVALPQKAPQTSTPSPSLRFPEHASAETTPRDELPCFRRALACKLES